MEQKTVTDKLSFQLQRWLREESPGRRTVLVRVKSSHDPTEAADKFREAGAAVESSGKGVHTVVVDRESLERLAELDWVLALDEPRQLFPKFPR